jgi:hypothetical protein
VVSIVSDGEVRLHSAIKSLIESGDPAAEPYILEFDPSSYWTYLRYRQDEAGKQKRLEFLQNAQQLNVLLEKYDLCIIYTAKTLCQSLKREAPEDSPGGTFDEAIKKQWVEFGKALSSTAMFKLYGGRLCADEVHRSILTQFGTEMLPSAAKVKRYNERRMRFLQTGKTE